MGLANNQPTGRFMAANPMGFPIHNVPISHYKTLCILTNDSNLVDRWHHSVIEYAH